MEESDLNADDETTITEISILPDGRVCVFGASLEVVEVLATLESRDATARQRVAHVRLLQQPQNRPQQRSES
jgi:hypothetical protein